MESADQLITAARNTIHSMGRRMTPQRAALMEIIEEASEHLDADEIYRRARERGERVSLSTVYRTLDLLKRLDLVDELHLSDEHHHYETRTSQEHYHLVCRLCGEVVEVSGPVVEMMKALVGRQHGFRIDRAQVDFVGLCERCQRGGEDESKQGCRG